MLRSTESLTRRKMSKQLDLFGWEPPKQTAPPEPIPKHNLDGLPPYDPNAFHRVYEIKADGSREWVDSYTSKYSIEYTMQIFYCNLRKWNFFDKNNLRKAKEDIKVSDTLRSVILEYDGHTYICTAKPGNSVIEGVSYSKFDFEPIRLR